MWVCGGLLVLMYPTAGAATHVHSVLVRELGKRSLELHSQLLPVDAGEVIFSK